MCCDALLCTLFMVNLCESEPETDPPCSKEGCILTLFPPTSPSFILWSDIPTVAYIFVFPTDDRLIICPRFSTIIATIAAAMD